MTDPEEIVQTATALQQSGDLQGAEKAYRMALATDVKAKSIYLGLAALLESQGRGQEARGTLNAALALYPDSPAMLSATGALLFRLDDTANAVGYFQKLAALLPDHIGAKYDLAVAYARNLDWAKAQEQAEQVLAVHPEDPGMLQIVSAALSLSGDVVRSLTMYDRLAAVRPLDIKPVQASSATASISMFNRSDPSPRYAELSKQYELMHSENHGTTQGSNDLTFAGILTFLRVAPYIRNMFTNKGYSSLLDYGGGQGQQYTLQNLSDKSGTAFTDMTAYLGVNSVEVYDAGRPETAAAVGKKYDAVICTDVLEHCDRLDLPWIVRELFEHAEKAVFATIATYPAGKHLPNGENAHCTLETAAWWSALFAACAQDFPAVDYMYLVVNDSDFNNVEAFAGGPNQPGA